MRSSHVMNSCAQVRSEVRLGVRVKVRGQGQGSDQGSAGGQHGRRSSRVMNSCARVRGQSQKLGVSTKRPGVRGQGSDHGSKVRSVFRGEQQKVTQLQTHV